MDLEIVGEISAYSMLVPFVVACVRTKRLITGYIPFLLLIFAGFLSELTVEILINLNYQFEVVPKVYSLLEAVLITWQFKKWDLFNSNKKIFGILIGFYSVIWILETIHLGLFKYYNSYFIIATSYVIAIMATTIINKLVIKIQGSLWKNPVFEICMGWLIYFTFSVLTESFFKAGFGNDNVFAARIYLIIQFVNIFTNVIFAIAILWVPPRPKFLLPS